MANRQEFSKAVRIEIIKRATAANGVIYCESCHLPTKRFEIDHIIADACKPAEDKKRKLTAKDGQLLCKGSPECCHNIKSAKHDTPAAAKCVRTEAKHLGADRPKKTIQSAGFPKSEKRPAINKSELPPLPRRNIYTGQIVE